MKGAIEGSKANEVGSAGVVGSYKEIQIHGPVEFTKDVERVYINKIELTATDPKGGDPITLAKEFCEKNNLDYEMFEY